MKHCSSKHDSCHVRICWRRGRPVGRLGGEAVIYAPANDTYYSIPDPQPGDPRVAPTRALGTWLQPWTIKQFNTTTLSRISRFKLSLNLIFSAQLYMAHLISRTSYL